MPCGTRLVNESLGYCKPCKCSKHRSLSRLLSICVFSVLAPRNLETLKRMSSLSVFGVAASLTHHHLNTG